MDGFWQSGPEFLRRPFEDWPIKTMLKKDERLEGDLLPKELVKRVLFTATKDCEMYKLLHSVGSMGKFRQHRELERLHRILAVILRWRNVSILRGTKMCALAVDEVKAAKLVWLKWSQKEIVSELEDSAAKKINKKRQKKDVAEEVQKSESLEYIQENVKTGKFR